jgi:CDGSH-type Zn-finger protein
MRCPTGALHFDRGDGGPPEPVPPANTVLVSRNGPTYLRGDIEMLDEQGDVRLRDTRVALCRCGLSKNKPLCDNAHVEAGFREAGAITDEDRVEDPGAEGARPSEARARLRVAPKENGPLELTGPFAISSADRKTVLAGTRTKLCRCGQSEAKPFCDGTHKRVGFKSS